VKDNDITVNVKLIQKDAVKYQFEVIGKKDDIKSISDSVVQKAADWIAKNK
jgi:hypothetical protein